MAARKYSSWMLERIAIGDTVRLRFGTSTIGRHSTSNIRVLEAGYVSRHHAIFEVADDDENVTITDVSSNGLFVNDKRYDKAVVQLRNDDLIGFGVSPVNLEEDVDVTSLPIYKIRFAPLRSFQLPNAATAAPSSSSKPVPEVNGPSNRTNNIGESLDNSIRDNETPSTSAAVKREKLFKPDEIFEISDDDENDVIVKPPPKPKESHKELLTALNQQIDIVIKSEPCNEKDKINPSQKSQEKQNSDLVNGNENVPEDKPQNDLSKTKVEKDKENENLEQPTTSRASGDKEYIKGPVLHTPIISNIKKERIRSVSNDIKNIFGDIDDDIDMQKAIKQINPFVYKEISDSKNIQLLDDQEKILTNGAMINLTEDEDLEEVEVEELGTIIPNITETKEKINSIIAECKKELDINKFAATTPNSTMDKEQASARLEEPKSPNLFDSSLDNSKEELNEAANNENNNKKEQNTDIVDNIDLNEYTKYVPQSDDEDIEDLMFSQVIFNDMKADLRDDLNTDENLPLANLNGDIHQQPSMAMAGSAVKIKQEPGLELFAPIPKELRDSCWVVSDEEEYDEELENKVNDWSNKIFSQSILSQNMSQVYDLEQSDKDDGNEEEEDFEEDNLDLLEDDLDGIAQIYNSVDETLAGKLAKSFEDETDINRISAEDLKKTSEIEDINKTEKKTEVNHKNEQNLMDMEGDLLKDEIVDLPKLIKIKEKSPVKYINDCESETQSPVVRERRLSKPKPISVSSSSSDDDHEIKSNKLPSYIKIPDKQKPKKLAKSLEDETDINRISAEDLKKTSEIENINKTEKKTEVNHKNEQNLMDMEGDLLKDEIVDLPKLIKMKEKSPVKYINDCESETQSPVVRERRLSKPKPISESSSSSDNEHEIKSNKLPSYIKIPDKQKPKIVPPVIEAPSLPKCKGKLRGVSADLPKGKGINAIKEEIRHERIEADLKRKWKEKSSATKKRDKERKKFIKDCRKDKLKELAERKKSPPKDAVKRKLSGDGNELKAKIAKVKVTTHNRGAFLASNESIPPPPAQNAQNQKADQKPQFKIPKISKHSDEVKKTPQEQSNNKDQLTRSLSMDGLETFSQQITKPDEVLLKLQNSETKRCEKTQQSNTINSNPAPSRRHSATDSNSKTSISERKKTPPPPSNTICKESIAKRAVRTTNKITFASMEKNITESEENKRKLSELNAKPSVPLKPIHKDPSTTKTAGKKKTVRFNDTPIIHYIERVAGACKKIPNKDVLNYMTTYHNRRHAIRSTYSIVDQTNKIISDILCWSNEWLIKRNAEADAASDVIFPMPTQFTSFEHYKSIILPLMKLEFASTLEREYNETKQLKNFKVSLEYATLNDDRMMLVTRFPSNRSREVIESSSYDLVLLEPDKRGPQVFAFVVANRKGSGSFTTIVYEIIAKNFTTEYFKAIKEFTVRPVMDRVRVHFGAFNSVYQLQSTPLFQKIINPLELLKCKPPKKKVIYRGFDQLNEKQKQVLLNTYVKIIDDTTPNITLIQGPPGTGKSLVITNLVLQSLYGEDVRYLDKKILICAQSNAAVDVLALKLFDISMRMRLEKRFRLLRYGLLNKMHPSVVPISLQKIVERDQMKKLQKNSNMNLENKENLKNQIFQFEEQIAEMSSRNVKGTVEEDELIEKKRQLQIMRNILNENMRPEDERSLHSWYLSNANIICTTLSSCVNLSQYVDFFDICIIDEATQCTEPWTLMPLKFGINSLVLVGDTQQLPATVLSKKANELGLGTSMFTRIQRCLDSIPSSSAKGATTPNNIIYSLQTQYRMHPDICRWPNQYFYRNELINAVQTIDFNKSPLVPFCLLNLSYTQNNSGINGKITNNLEAEFVAKLLKALDGFIPNKYNSYGVITPYAHHRATLDSAIRVLGLTNIMVNTIDSYQGLEKDVIVISNARTSGIGFLSNPQRLNVALTRAKKCLILCGNFRNLESVPAWRSLLQSARERKVYYEISPNCMEDIQTHVIDKIKLRNQNQ